MKRKFLGKSRKRNNAGLTLVELIVTILIMSMVMLAAAGLIVSASNSYRVSNIEIEFQMEAQTALNQLNDILVEANNYRYDAAAQRLDIETGEKIYRFEVDDANDRLLFYSKARAGDPFGTGALLAKYMDSFSVEPAEGPGDDSKLVTIVLNFTYSGRSYTTTSCISLRGGKAIENEESTED